MTDSLYKLLEQLNKSFKPADRLDSETVRTVAATLGDINRLDSDDAIEEAAFRLPLPKRFLAFKLLNIAKWSGRH